MILSRLDRIIRALNASSLFPFTFCFVRPFITALSIKHSQLSSCVCIAALLTFSFLADQPMNHFAHGGRLSTAAHIICRQIMCRMWGTVSAAVRARRMPGTCHLTGPQCPDGAAPARPRPRPRRRHRPLCPGTRHYPNGNRWRCGSGDQAAGRLRREWHDGRRFGINSGLSGRRAAIVVSSGE